MTVDENDGEFVIINLDDSDCRLMVRTGRLYTTREEAEKHLPYKKYQSCSFSGRNGITPWDYNS